MIRQMAVPDHAGIEAAGRVHRSTPWSGHSRKVRRIDRPEVSGRIRDRCPTKQFSPIMLWHGSADSGSAVQCVLEKEEKKLVSLSGGPKGVEYFILILTLFLS
jgi:hypothetical protein